MLVVGALHLDVIVNAPHLPALDETLMGSAVAYAFGGKGGNQAVAAARMGADVAMAGRVGDDSFATTVLAALDGAGVDRTGVIQGPGATGMSVAIVDAAGDYGAVVVSGVNREIRAQDVVLPDDLSVVILQNEVPEAVNLGLLDRLPVDVCLIVNAAPARPLPPALLQRCDVLIVNRVEAVMMVGDEPGAEKRLHSMGAGSVILTLGAGGLAGWDDRGGFRIGGHRVKVISTHGAGDAFVGALAARLAAGDPLRQAAQFATAAAALHVHRPVDERAGITPADVLEFLRQSAI